MYDEFSYLGTWWIPSIPNREWPGVVSYKPSTGIELELAVRNGDVWHDLTQWKVKDVEIIYGRVAKFPYSITLTNISVLKSASSRSAAMFSAILRAEFLLLGGY